jgi:HD superfamily phosphohydrolase
MYWQVYLHKTALSVEQMIVQIIRRASFASQLGMEVFAPPYLRIFLERNVGKLEFETNPDLLDAYLLLDDYDIWTCIKQWMLHPDKVLSDLCRALLNRKPFKVMLENEPIDQVIKDKIAFDIQLHLGINTEDLGYYMFEGIISNKAYVRGDNNINILKKNGEVLDIAQASDLPNIMAMSKIVSKYYLCYHKPISLRD